MSSYTKLIIFIAVLLVISAAVVFIDSSVDNINKTMPEISDSIVNGDKDYNDRSFDESKAKAESAGNSYNDSLKKVQDIKSKFSNDLNAIQNEYFDTIINELNLKLQAVDKLKLAIDCFEVYSNYTGTTYASEANDLIYEAAEYQNERNGIVNDNPKLFK